MASRADFDWRGWYDSFYLSEEVLGEVWSLYPGILAARQMSSAVPLGEIVPVPLSDGEVRAILSSGKSAPSLEESFDHYLEEGEIHAATVLVKKVAAHKEEPVISLQRKVSQRQQELELEFGRLNAQLTQNHRNLVSLGLMAQDDPDLGKVKASADSLFRLKRLGPAVQLLRGQVGVLDIQVRHNHQHLKGEIERYRLIAEKLGAPGLKAAMMRLVDRAEAFLQRGQLGLAQRTIHRAQVVHETGEVPPPQESIGEAEGVPFREEFPAIRARDILDYLESQQSTARRAFKVFLEQWCPDDWKQGRSPSRKEDPTYPMYEAVLDLGRTSASGSSYPFSGRARDPWRLFLKDLFDLMGQRGFAPDKAEELSVRPVKETPIGFWLSRCGKDLTIQHSFLDPARLPNGLHVIFWHRPNDPLCPKPANLENELRAKGLTGRPLLCLAGEPILPEDRQALHRAVPTAALLDERDLLRIIFCSSEPQDRAAHFAQAIGWQLPFDLASPYSEQGEVNSAMFVGRDDVLRQLSDPQGPTVLYGGRKLGKSSIFRQLQRNFERRSVSPGQNIAIYVNAINVVDDTGIEHTLLPKVTRELRSRLRYARTEDPTTALDLYIPADQVVRCDDFANHIIRILQALPHHHFLLLIDEADSLLQYLDTPNDRAISAAKRFGWTLRGLVQDSGGRFDVRLAGFQEISRAAQSHSGPFYNFRRGAPELALTIFEPSEARELILRPLQLLRTTFDDDSLLDMILDFAGQHPALLQEFCRHLYRRVRVTGRLDGSLIRLEDVEAIWQDPGFRKSVIRAIHLNVETRNTKREKILRLLLYLWVRQIMAPNGYPAIATVCQPTELYQLLCKVYGEQAVERQIQVSQLDNYMSDLATLGVLEKHGRGYVFRYRYFANLLFYDYFGGQLGDSVTNELWESIVSHEDQPARLQIRAGDELSVSPFTRVDQERLEQEGSHVSLILGAPDTGKTAFFQWLGASRQQETGGDRAMRMIDATGCTFEELRGKLSTALDLDPIPPTWQAFGDLVAARWTRKSPVTWVVLDQVDDVAGDEDWPLLEWPSAKDRIRGDDGLLFTLARMMRLCEGRLRFCLVGTFPLARLWVDTADLLAETATTVVTQRLAGRERDTWFEAAKLIATPEVKRRVWDLTRGDWRLLSSLRDWLRHRKVEEPEESHIKEFQQLLNPFRPQILRNLGRALERYDIDIRDTLRELMLLSVDVGTEADDVTWAELLVERFQTMPDSRLAGWTQRRWLIELRAAVLLQELEAKTDARTGDLSVVIPVQDTWFRLLTGTDA